MSAWNHIKHSKKTIISISLILLVLSMIIWVVSSHHVWTELDYCKELSRKLGCLHLDYFQCQTIDSSRVDSNYIAIRFKAEPFYDGPPGFFVEDVANVKEVIESYLTEYPNHKLNLKKIAIQFEYIPGIYIVMTNFDAEALISREKFAYYSFFNLDINKAFAFQDAYSIELKVKDECSAASIIHYFGGLHKIWDRVQTTIY